MRLLKSYSSISLLIFSAIIYACKSTDTTVTPSTASITAPTCGKTIFSADPVIRIGFTGRVIVAYIGGKVGCQ